MDSFQRSGDGHTPSRYQWWIFVMDKKNLLLSLSFPFVFVLGLQAQLPPAATLALKKTDKSLEIQALLPQDITKLELRIERSRNKCISRFSERKSSHRLQAAG